MEQKHNVAISVIMPVYKVEAYVAKAIESILAQSFTDFEFLIVDDGSPDASGAICDSYAKTDSRIQVIHKENGGAPSARNAAMEIARGKYMYFLDSDDWAEPDMLKDMYELAERHEAQLVICGFYIDTYYGAKDKAPLSEKISAGDAVYVSAQAFRKNAYKYYDRNLLYTPWNKLYLSSYLMERGLRFPNTLWDDFPFNISVVRDISRVSVSDAAYYHFIRQRAESETAAYHPEMYEKREEEHTWLLQLYRYWNVRDIAAKEMLSRRYIERLVGCFANLTSSKCTLSHRARIASIREMLENPRIDKALRYARPRSLYMKVMLIPIRMKNSFLIWLESAVITHVQERHGRLFARLKAGR